MPFQAGISGTHLESCKHEWSCGYHDLHSSSVCSGYGLSSALSLWAHLCQLDWHFQTHCKYQGCSNPSAAAAAQDQGLKQCRAPALLTRQWGWGPSWAQPCSPSAADRAGWDPHHTDLQQSNTQSRLRAQELCVAPQPVGGNISLCPRCLLGLWARSLLLL